MDYSIKPIGRACAASGAELKPGTTCRSALVEREGRFERFDYLAQEWRAPPEGTVGHWRTVVPSPAKPRPRKLDAEALLQEFERLEETGHEQVRRLRYVLALLLLQKRRLELDGCRIDGEIEYLVLIGAKGEGPFEVRDEGLEPEEIASVQEELLASLTAMDETPNTG